VDDLRYEPGEGVDGSRQRRVALAIVAIFALVLGGIIVASRLDTFGNEGCKGVGIAAAIGDGTPGTGAADAETAVRAFATRGVGVRLAPTPMPTDGWHLDRGAWASDVDHGYYRMGVHETDAGWFVDSVSYCSR